MKDQKTILLQNRLENGRRNIINKSRVCLFPGCKKKAIDSHVLQKKGILQGIIDKTNHFYSIGHTSVFSMNDNKLFNVVKVGINDGYTFLGFCNDHDTQVFIDIETHPIDLAKKRNQALFTYRTICLEFRKQEMYLEINKDIFKTMEEFEPDKKHFVILQPAEQAIKDMMFYKTQLEAELFDQKHSTFDIQLIELSEKKICFSAAMSIHDSTNEFTFDVDAYGFPRVEPMAVSIVNYFPYQGKSYLIAASHKTYFCNWTRSLISDLTKSSSEDKIISDLLTYRLEFWGISPDLYESFSNEKKKQFVSEAHAHANNFNYKIETDFNLFS